MKHITIEMSEDGVAYGLDELVGYTRRVKEKLNEVCRRLVEIGIEEANAQLVLADGNTDVYIDPTPVKTKNGYKMVMGGSDVYFVEFGTGDATTSNGYLVNVAVYPGSYSEQHKGQYYKNGFWFYGGEKYTETRAYMPMYFASRAMRAALPRVVKEVFD